DGVQQVGFGNLVVHEEGLCDGAGIGQTGGLDDDAVKQQGAGAALGGQIGQGGAQVFTDGAADAPVVHLNDLFLAVIDQDVVVDVFFTEFVFDDRNLLAVCFGQYAFEQRGFAAAKKTGKDGDGYEAHHASV